MLNTIFSEIEVSDKPILRIIFRNNVTRIAIIGLKKGMRLVDHQLPVDARIIMLEGEIEIDSKIEIINLKKFNEYEIPRKVIHQVRTNENAMLMIILNFES